MTAKSASSSGRRAARTVRHPSGLYRNGLGLLGKPSGGRMRKKLAAIQGMPVFICFGARFAHV